MKKSLALLAFSAINIIFSCSVFGQESTVLEPKNIIHGSVGILGLGFAAIINYERLVVKTEDRKYLIKCYAHGGVGYYAEFGLGYGPTFVTSFKGILGRKNAHLELGLGITGLVNNGNYEYDYDNYLRGNEPKPTRLDHTWLLPAGTIGYRYQTPGEDFVFRTGVGFPDGVYISIGFAFFNSKELKL